MSGDSIPLPFGLDMSAEPVRADEPNAITTLLDLLPPASGLPTTYAAAMVLDLENFNGMPAAEITNRGTSLDPAQVAGQSESWAMFQRSIRNAAASFSDRVKDAGGDGFSGAFPDAVAAYHQSFVADNLALAESIASPVDRLDAFSDALNTVKSRISLVAFVDYAPTVLATVSLARPNPQLSAIMESAYSPSVLTAGSQIAAFPGPRELGGPGGGAGAAAGAAERFGGDGGDGAGAPQPLPGGDAASGPVGAGTDGVHAEPGANGQSVVSENGADGQRPSGQTPNGGGANDAAISQAGLSPDSAQSAGNSNAGGRGAVSPAAGGLGGAAAVPMAGPMAGGPAGGSAGRAGAFGSSGPGRGGALGSVGGGQSGWGGQGGANGPSGSGGQSGQGGSGALGGKTGMPRGAAPGEGGASNNAMAGRRGISNNMMGGGAGGGRGQGEEDDAYTPAEFLTTLDNGDKLIGPLPRVVHPVIGAWGP